MNKTDKIYVAGHRGLAGSAITRRLEAEGFKNLVLRASSELDLRDQGAVAAFFEQEEPDHVFLAAARVGGIVANKTYPAEFIYDNLTIQSNIIHSAWRAQVKRLLFLGSTCIYPKLAPQPMKEEYLFTGPLEPSNRPYALAKIAGIEMCRAYNRQYGTRFLAVMPTNLYGPHDNFDLETSHVLPALIRKFHEAKVAGNDTVTVWGTGAPYREFLHVDDLAAGVLFLINLPDDMYKTLIADPVVPALINVGSGEELTIKELALLIKKVVGFGGELIFDTTKPDGTPRKLCDVSRIHALGWRHGMKLPEGITMTYEWFLSNFGEKGLV